MVANKQGFQEYLTKKYSKWIGNLKDHNSVNLNISKDTMIRETATIWIYSFGLTGKQAEEAWDNVYKEIEAQGVSK